MYEPSSDQTARDWNEVKYSQHNLIRAAGAQHKTEDAVFNIAV
jgi:hypothetical protein